MKLYCKSFGLHCRAANVLHLISKLRYKVKGIASGFKAFLKSKGEKCGLFVHYISNRLHKLFHLAGIVYHHQDLIPHFLEGFFGAQQISLALKADLREPYLLIQLQVLGLMGKLLTGPWMPLFYTRMKERNHLEMIEHHKACIHNLMELQDEPWEALTKTTDTFGKPLVTEDMLKAVQQAPSDMD